MNAPDMGEVPERGFDAVAALARMNAGRTWKDSTISAVLVVAFWAVEAAELPAEGDEAFVGMFGKLLREAVASLRAGKTP